MLILILIIIILAVLLGIAGLFLIPYFVEAFRAPVAEVKVSGWGGKLAQLFSGQTKKREEIHAELEALLLSADVGVAVTQRVLTALQERKLEPTLTNYKTALKEILLEILKIPENFVQSQTVSTQVILVVGVNGVGKTTTIAKLARSYQQQNKKVLLVAADTFRAGATDQLKVWGERLSCPVVSQQEGADPGAVAFDGVKSGLAKKIDFVLIDTAGRLHSKINLMEELKKVKRVVGKAMEGAPHEIYLVVDATSGQNVLQQARLFHEAMQLTGVILTKWDSTAKGGSIFSVTQEIGVPVCYLGVGEKMTDLMEFNPHDFVDKLLS
ncbi:MAG: signal recognition particle-docking protein FtsY [Deltaproteobacteria bacterium]|nr:signal recognition particle-docking protein FtsY [Deltaproteobacteria bacterium]